MNRVVRIGSRDSKLAVIQAEIVRDTIQKSHPEIRVEMITMKTTGDIILDRSLDEIGGKGLFVKELDQALQRNEIDISVHSLKDMPMELPEDLPILAYTKREDPRDVLLYKPGIKHIGENGVIGTSSKRRTLQLQSLFPHQIFRGIRGNVYTRLHKLQEEEYDGIVLAAAGINRLKLHSHAYRVFEVTEVIPAAGQGILAVQGRKGEDAKYLECLQHRESTMEALAERRFIQVLDGGCSSPIAAYAKVQGEEIQLTGLHFDERSKEIAIKTVVGTVDQCEQMGELLAIELKQRFE